MSSTALGAIGFLLFAAGAVLLVLMFVGGTDSEAAKPLRKSLPAPSAFSRQERRPMIFLAGMLGAAGVLGGLLLMAEAFS